MSGEVTARDHVWAAITEMGQGQSFTTENVRDKISEDQQPSNETIRRVLRSATKLGVIEHEANSPYYMLVGGWEPYDAEECNRCGGNFRITFGQAKYQINEYKEITYAPIQTRENLATVCAECIEEAMNQLAVQPRT